MKTILILLALLTLPLHAASAATSIGLEWDYDFTTVPEDERAGFKFELEHSPDGKAWSALQTATETKTTVANLAAGSTWYFRVSAVGGSGARSEPSNVVRVWIPAAPAGLKTRVVILETSDDLQTWTQFAVVVVPEAETSERSFYRLAFASTP
jgi:hypothetical protein